VSLRWFAGSLIWSLITAGCSSEGDDPSAPGSQGGTSAHAGDSSSGGRAGTGVAGGGAGGASSGGGKASGGGTSSGGTSGTAGASASGGTSEAGGASGSGGSAGGSGGVGGSPAGGRGGSGGSAAGEYGFEYRVPGSHPFTCEDQPYELPDADWVCTFSQGDRLAYVYVQASPVEAMCVLAVTGIYEVTLAQLSIDGVVTSLSNAAYDWGGGHHNDSVSFDHAGKTYKYYHSSFGFGFRACQPMDCLSVYEPGATAPEIEGCGSDRSLPEVCVPIDEQGTHEALVDEFMKCPGDTQ
jgi:hypothetical protein